MKRAVKHVSDYVILGAGSAGCVVTRRLVDSGHKVALVEAGNSDIGRWDSWTIQMPSALTYSVADQRYNWDFHTTPQKHLNGRRIHEPRGKVLGGSSSINAMVYLRGHAMDFERWEKEEGATGWGYADCLPYFKRAQAFTTRGGVSEGGDGKYRGGGGPLKVMGYEKGTRTNVLFDAFEQAGSDAGYDITDDINGYQQEGFGSFDMTVDATTGERCSASHAYLHPIMRDAEKSKCLTLKTGVIARRLLFERDADGPPRAMGVECEDLATGEVFEMHATKEVISSLGAVGSPHLLMLSGIGNSEELTRKGVEEVVHHNPHVGSNLQDHLEVYLQYLCVKPVSLYPIAAWTLRYLHERVGAGLQWFAKGTGVCASNQFETGAFIRSAAGIAHPDVQMHFIPACVTGQLDVLKEHGFQMHVGTMRPTSRGSITLENNDPKCPPIIDPNFLATEQDVVDLRNAVRLAEELVHQPGFAPYKGSRYSPAGTATATGSDSASDKDDNFFKSDEKVDEWIRNSSHSAYHLSCTCAMGKVVDEEGLVKGVRGLRVVDASIMPSMTSGNLNAPTIMLAEKIADCIQGNAPLPREEQPFFVHDHWRTQQR